MARSQLFGRRVHVAGSISTDRSVAPSSEVELARAFVEELVKELLHRGTTFVIPVDAEKVRSVDDLPICFDWLVWKTLHANLAMRPADSPDPLAIAVQHHKNEDQIPANFVPLWDSLRASDRVRIENVSYWNMACKRMEAQAKWGDILIVLGGSDGVLYLANLYHDAGKPIIPLNFAISPSDTGARRLFAVGQSPSPVRRLFNARGHDADVWINRINFTDRQGVPGRVSGVLNLMEDLDPPKAFAIRLMDPEHPDYEDVQTFFETVVQPVVKDELGYRVVVVDGRQNYEYPRIDQEIFAKLHRSSFVIADVTGMRPNCLLELGYALGRGLRTMLMAKDGTEHPFDIRTLGAHTWKTSGAVEERRRAFLEHWVAIQNRPSLVPMEPLIL